MTSKNMKGYYKQKKKKKNNTKGGITKSKSSKSTKTSLDHQDDYNDEERVIRQFDMNMAYGPCFGITRLTRWERAQKLGLNPPKEIENLLKDGKVKSESIFDGRL